MLGGRGKDAVVIAAFAVAVGAGVVSLATEGDGAGASAAPGLPPTEQVARRVEAVRGLRFKEIPRVEVLSAEQLERRLEAVAEEEMSSLGEDVRRQAAAAEQLMRLAGVIDEQGGAEHLATGEDAEIGGVYVPSLGRIFLVDEAVEADRREAEIILAHELTHALEDQAFGSFERPPSPFTDRATARQAVLEGSATLTEIRYGIRHLGAKPPAERVLKRQREELSDAELPPALRLAVTFPYVTGGHFADQLFDRERGWELVNRALRRPPRTTETIFHPHRFGKAERPATPAVGAGDALGDGWSAIGRAELGELDTRALLRVGVDADDAARGAAGWAGGAFAVWARDEGCRGACRDRSAALLAWRWDGPRDATEFARALARYVAEGVGGDREGGAWRVGRGWAAMRRSGRATSLAFAPSVQAAARLAARGVSGGGPASP
jgi:hypothetical protein